MKDNYVLMHRDVPVLHFNTGKQTVSVLNKELLPYSLTNKAPNWGMISHFCSSRILSTNREYCKEILTSCGIEDQTDLNICLISKGLSFRDHYWIKQEDSLENWESVNLYDNPFSAEIAYTSLTGESCSVQIGDKLFTGELTGKGTRAKCHLRVKNQIVLVKRETSTEISAEIISAMIARNMNLAATTYVSQKVFGKESSLCVLQTSKETELLPCRDVIDHYMCPMSENAPYYRKFMWVDPQQFIKMQLFDYITLNTDRNRDNFGLKKQNGRITGLYPIFDHDSCYKGKSESALYFVTGKPFAQLEVSLINRYSYILQDILPDIKKLHTFLNESGEEIFSMYQLQQYFDDTIERTEKVLSWQLKKEHTLSTFMQNKTEIIQLDTEHPL